MKNRWVKVKPKGKLSIHTYLADNAGCGHIRVIFPSLMLNQIRHNGLMFNATYNSHFIDDKNFYHNVSFVKFQRSVTLGQLNLIERCRLYSQLSGNFGILYEIDDLLTPDIPETNYASEYYKQHWNSIKEILNTVDGIIVSTEKLKSELTKYTKRNIRVFKNRLCDWLWHQQNWTDHRHDKIRILWAGSQNHFSMKGSGGDFNKELLNFILSTTNKYDWMFVGACPNELKDNSDIKKYEWQNIFNFGYFLNSLEPDIGLAPLEKCIFNDCKSNIKALEFASLGIPGAYSDAEPYKNMELSSTDSFIENIEKLCNNSELREEIWKNDYKKLASELYWNKEYLIEYVNTHLKFYGKILG